MTPEAVAIIPARGGSKGLPRKNIALIAGRPLLAWTIEAARTARTVDRVLVSTDDEEIAAVAREAGAEVPFIRPTELSLDETPGVAPVLHAVNWLEQHQQYLPEWVVLLQPTSPLRTGMDIDAALMQAQGVAADCVVSVNEASHHPYWMKVVSEDGWIRDFCSEGAATTRRQDLPVVFALNGAIYAIRRTVLLATGNLSPLRTCAYRMPADRGIDIDTRHDLEMADWLLTREHTNR